MTDEHDRPEEPQTLSDEDARRLLARASEIDSAQSAELPLTDLRQASLEAGIAPNAFEQALVELRGGHAVADSGSASIGSTTRRRLPAGLLNSLKTVGIVLATLFVLMVLVDLIG
jgi:hypothetical protein